jgi:hypothetical protein
MYWMCSIGIQPPGAVRQPQPAVSRVRRTSAALTKAVLRMYLSVTGNPPQTSDFHGRKDESAGSQTEFLISPLLAIIRDRALMVSLPTRPLG